jgi:hypothetical protein
MMALALVSSPLALRAPRRGVAGAARAQVPARVCAARVVVVRRYDASFGGGGARRRASRVSAAAASAAPSDDDSRARETEADAPVVRARARARPSHTQASAYVPGATRCLWARTTRDAHALTACAPRPAARRCAPLRAQAAPVRGARGLLSKEALLGAAARHQWWLLPLLVLPPLTLAAVLWLGPGVAVPALFGGAVGWAIARHVTAMHARLDRIDAALLALMKETQRQQTQQQGGAR